MVKQKKYIQILKLPRAHSYTNIYNYLEHIPMVKILYICLLSLISQFGNSILDTPFAMFPLTENIKI